MLLHSDATQAVGKIPVDVDQLGVDLMSSVRTRFTGRRDWGGLRPKPGPAGPLEPLLYGGGHESGLRSSTLNVPGLSASRDFGTLWKKCRPKASDCERCVVSTKVWRRFPRSTQRPRPRARPSGDCRATNVSFSGVDGESLLLVLKNLAVSTGSACNLAAARAESRATGPRPERFGRGSSLRFGLGRFNTAEEVEQVIAAISTAVPSFDK